MSEYSLQARRWILGTLFVFFSLLLAAMIWWQEYSWRNSFTLAHVSFNAEPAYIPLSTSALQTTHIDHDPNKPTIVHFIDSECSCNRFSVPHINHLSLFTFQFANNYIYYLSPKTVDLLKLHLLPSKAIDSAFGSGVQATPAVGIWDKEGRLAYYGAYSSGAICGEGDDLVKYTLANLGKQQNPEWTNNEAVGCYCLQNEQ